MPKQTRNEPDAESRKYEFAKRFGVYGEDILSEGDGGGFTAVPHAIDIYQDALGLTIKEAWFLKIIMRYLPDIRPSMAKIAERTGQRKATLSAIKKGLAENGKGFIRDCGAVDMAGGRMQRRLDITPFFDAVFLCMACDPNSKLARSQASAKARTVFTRWIHSRDGYSEVTADLFENGEKYAEVDLPLTIEAAKEFAKAKGITLNWTRLESMQGESEMAKHEDMKADKMRELELKDAIKAGGMELRMFPNIYREWFLPLCKMPIRAAELESLTEAYVEKAETVNAKEYREWITAVLESAENRRIMAERQVYQAEAL
jgi:DNA-binding MarR family transcriptional regulator